MSQWIVNTTAKNILPVIKIRAPVSFLLCVLYSRNGDILNYFLTKSSLYQLSEMCKFGRKCVSESSRPYLLKFLLIVRQWELMPPFFEWEILYTLGRSITNPAVRITPVPIFMAGSISIKCSLFQFNSRAPYTKCCISHHILF